MISMEFPFSRIMKATNMNSVSFISISSSFHQTPIGFHTQKKKISQQVSSHEWVMIRRNLNLSLRRFAADIKGIPELLLLRDQTQQQQHHHHRFGCAGEESSSAMADELKKPKDGSIEEKIQAKELLEEKDLDSPLKSPSPPSPPEKPLPGDCCGNGCIPCVWDTYNEELEEYNNLLKAYNSQSKP